MKDREFNIEDAYQIFVIFTQHFWWDHLRHIMIEKGLVIQGLTPEKFEKASPEDRAKYTLYKANNFVFNTVPGDPYGCGSYLEKVIEGSCNISKSRKIQEFKIKEEKLFQLVIDFCYFFTNQFKDYPKSSMYFAIDWLEDMRKSPENHRLEWDLWNECIHDVVVDGYKSSANFAD